MSNSFSVYGLKLPVISPGEDIVEHILRASTRSGVGIEDKDIVVVTSKILSKAMGLLVNIETIEPSKEAIKLAKKTGLEPRVVELIIRESDDIVFAIPFKKLVDEGVIDLSRMAYDLELGCKAVEYYPTILVTIRDDMLWSDSGIDTSNHPRNIYSIPPRDLDRVAKELALRIRKRTGKQVAVVICDTEFFIGGSIEVARGCTG